jgi:chemotaxis protein CheD
MELLIGEIIKKGGDRKTLKAKCFGGGQVLNFRHSDGNIPDSNIRFVRKFFKLENIPLIKEDVGGSWARKIYLFIPEGRILLKRLPSLPQEFLQGEGKYKSRLFQRRVEPPSLTLF